MLLLWCAALCCSKCFVPTFLTPPPAFRHCSPCRWPTHPTIQPTTSFLHLFTDPTLQDPRIDPKKAARIMANRLSAAKSKMKQKSQVNKRGWMAGWLGGWWAGRGGQVGAYGVAFRPLFVCLLRPQLV